MKFNGNGRTLPRNLQLYKSLLALRKTPRSPRRRDEWINAAIDLTKTVLVIQFASLRNSQDRDDLEQAALLEFHRCGPKLAALTDTMDADRLFRVLYSVAKYSMFKELAKLKKGHVFYTLVTTTVREDVEGEETLEDDVVQIAVSACGEERVEEIPADRMTVPETVVHEMEQAAMVEDLLPQAIIRAVDDANMYARTQWGEAVRFCAFQRLRGRFPSVSMIRERWQPPDCLQVIAYGDHLARNAVLQVRETVAR